MLSAESPGHRIALDVTASLRAGRDRGLGRYLEALWSGLEAEPDIDLRLVSGIRHVPPRAETWVSVAVRRARLARLSPYIYHATSCYDLVPGVLSRTVCSVLDVIPIDHPGYVKTGIRTRYFHNLILRVPRIVVLSEHTRERLVSVLGVDPSRIVRAPMPVPRLALEATTSLALPARPFIVGMADLRAPDPRKRYHLLAEAAEQLSRRGIATVLLGPGTESFDGKDRIRGLGRVSDADLAAVLRSAEVMFFSSAYEGQGLPPQEALSVGTPVVAFRNSSLPEMLGGGAVFIDEDPEDDTGRTRIAAVVEACAEIIDHPTVRSHLAQAGSLHVAQFDRARFLSGVRSAYDAVSPL
ncbi:MAG TPA: glycosyltransferase [Mycobacteriales bacterium]|nr:glycosyltransferase [Mycobacteriales bacterium]